MEINKNIMIDPAILSKLEAIAEAAGISTHQAIERAVAFYIGGNLVSKRVLAEFNRKIAKVTYDKDQETIMEIELTENQKNAIESLTGHNEKELLMHLINIGICFYGQSPAKRKLIMELLEPGKGD